ncbi:hypothetical protein Tco_1440288 [Tanacetum coccineum]
MLAHATEGEDSRDSLEGTNGNEEDQVQTPHDSPLSGGHTSDKAEGTLNQQELFVLCTNMSNRVLILESIKDAQAAEISALKSIIKKLEKKCKPSISHHRAWLQSVKILSMKKLYRTTGLRNLRSFLVSLDCFSEVVMLMDEEGVWWGSLS